MTGLQAYVLSKKYTAQSLDGVGALKGAPCTIKSTTETDEGTIVVFGWTDNNDTTQETTILIKNGAAGNGIAKIEKINTVDLVDTYRITFDDGGTFDYEVINGGGSGSGKIDIVKVNGVELPVIDKAVDITIPEYIYIGNTEPTDENVVLWVNPDESGGGGAGGSGTAEDTSYTNENFPQYDNVDLALDALFNKVYYVKPTCSLSATPRGGAFEMGTVISAPITFTWTTNKDITSQTLTGCTLADASVRTATYNTNVTSDKIFTLSVSDGENSASNSISYKFLNNIFWGSATTAEIYDSAFISALSNKKLASDVKGTYSFNITSGEYGFWAVPSNMSISSVWISGFEVTVDDLGIVSYTNAQGYTRDYRIYKTGRSGLGAISAEIK